MTKIPVLSPVPSIAVGLGMAVCIDRALIRYVPEHRVTIYAALLAGAGAVYPLARTKMRLGAQGLFELAGLSAYSAVGIVVARSQPPVAARLVAIGWASHAMFDLVHETGNHSKIPEWYPAFCAAYDLGVAALLTAFPPSQSRS